MKLLFILREFPKTSETFILSQVAGMIGLGHDVSVVSLRDARDKLDLPELEGRIRWLGYRSSSIGKAAKMLSSIFSGGFKPDFLRYSKLAAGPLGMYFYKPYCEGVFTDTDAIVIHFGDFAHDCAFLSDRLGIGTPVAVVFHGVDVARHIPAMSIRERERLWRFMSLGLPVSEYWKNRLVELGCPAEKLSVQHMGVDTGAFGYRKRVASSCPRFLSVCRLVEKKGIDTAIEALARVNGRMPSLDFNYDIVGDGPLMQELVNKAASLGIGDRVVFYGRKSPGEARSFYDAADLYLLPSRTALNGDMEGIPVSLMEAMASGLPVLSTRHSGIPELIRDNVSGLLVSEGDAAGLADAVERILRDPAFAILLGSGARERVERDFNHETLMGVLGKKLENMII